MPSPLLILTFCAFLPANAEVDMTPVLAPAILVEEGSLSADSSQSVEVLEVAEVPKSSRNVETTLTPDLGPALVVDSKNE